ncbi:unnamed protein product [Linum trigynum]|uniref:Aminotransferase-like plant mobile domain-containing protein n=1 Tax=Linum trigynum TaxID=586398 RepID=A0AAV2E461_9ROSI
MLNVEHEFINYLVGHARFGDKFAYQRESPVGSHWQLDLDMFIMFRCRAAKLGVVCHPQWRLLLTMDELIYHELCLEFYSTFDHVVPTGKRSQSYVEFMLAGQSQVLTYDAFAKVMGLDLTHMTMKECQYRPENEHEEYEASRTNAVKLRTPWRILHTLLTRLVIPILQSGQLMTNGGILALFSMWHPAEPIHLGSLIVTSFAWCLGWNRVDTMHMGGNHHEDCPPLRSGCGAMPHRRED